MTQGRRGDDADRQRDEDDPRSLAAEDRAQRLADTQVVIASILELALADIPVDELLRRTLDLILSVQWLRIERKGSIFLVEDEPEVLVMKAQTGLGLPVLQSCSRVAFGHCLCGQAAATREPVHASDLDERHTVAYDDILPHGHYCIPICRGEVSLGVINVYLVPGHAWADIEVEFLRAVANTLAGVITRRRAEDDRRAMQQRLEDALRAEAVGNLAYGVAHDFGNLLSVFKTSAELLLRDLPPDDRLRKVAEIMQSAAQRGMALTQQLKSLGREDAEQPAPLVLGELVRDIEPMLRLILGDTIVLRLELADGGAQVLADRSQIERAIVNLAANARDAMSERGRLTVRTFLSRPDEVSLAVSDTGSGMPPEVAQRVFEPYFTTKPRGQGSGLGLATVRRIVNGVGGSIDVESRPGAGTTFTLRFPRVSNDG